MNFALKMMDFVLKMMDAKGNWTVYGAMGTDVFGDRPSLRCQIIPFYVLKMMEFTV